MLKDDASAPERVFDDCTYPIVDNSMNSPEVDTRAMTQNYGSQYHQQPYTSPPGYKIESQEPVVPRTKFGLPVTIFWIVVVVLALIVGGAIGGGAAAGVLTNNKKNSSTAK